MNNTFRTPRPRALIAGNTSTGTLKLIALACMLADHLGAACFTQMRELRVFGRIAFPLYCWCIVVGASRTRSMPRYMLRLALVGLISQPVYMVALNHAWDVPNIFLTLLVGLAGIWGLQERRWFSHIWAPLAALLLAEPLGCGKASYGFYGVALILLLWAVKDSRKGISAAMLLFCLVWGNLKINFTTGAIAAGNTVTRFYDINLFELTRSGIGIYFKPWIKLQSMAILALPLMIWPDSIRVPIWDLHRNGSTERPAISLRPTGTVARLLSPWHRMQGLSVSAHTGEAAAPLQLPNEAVHLTVRTRMPGFRMPAWLGYAIYPLHLLIVIAVDAWVFLSNQAIPAELSIQETLQWAWTALEDGRVINYHHLIDAWELLCSIF